MAVSWNRMAANLWPLIHARVVWGMALLLLTIHFVIEWNGGPDLLLYLYQVFGLQVEGVLSGRLWQPVTYGFLHGSWSHVAVNAVCLVLIGAKLEWMVGRKNFFLCAMAGVFAGAMSHLLMGVTRDSVLVGFSGGCVALLLLLTTVSPESRMFPFPISAKNLGLGILLAEFFMALIDPGLNFPGFSAIGHFLESQGLGNWFRMGHACHFGGGVAGFLYGRWLLRPRVTQAALWRARQRGEERNSR